MHVAGDDKQLECLTPAAFFFLLRRERKIAKFDSLCKFYTRIGLALRVYWKNSPTKKLHFCIVYLHQFASCPVCKDL